MEGRGGYDGTRLARRFPCEANVISSDGFVFMEHLNVVGLTSGELEGAGALGRVAVEVAVAFVNCLVGMGETLLAETVSEGLASEGMCNRAIRKPELGGVIASNGEIVGARDGGGEEATVTGSIVFS